MAIEPARYLSPAQCAEIIGIPLTTLYTWQSNNTAPPRSRLGKHIRYTEADIHAWVESKKVA